MSIVDAPFDRQQFIADMERCEKDWCMGVSSLPGFLRSCDFFTYNILLFDPFVWVQSGNVAFLCSIPAFLSAHVEKDSSVILPTVDLIRVSIVFLIV